MANVILVQFIVLLLAGSAFSKVDRVHRESYLGEKNLEMYAERYRPLIYQDIYQGELSFTDELFFRNYFTTYLFPKENEYSEFLNSELSAGLLCSNELLSKHFDDIRYAYRLVTLSYFLESNWHMKLMSDALYLKNGCQFNLKSWLETCRPRSEEMKKFVGRLSKFLPKYEESVPVNFTKKDWISELSKKEIKWQSQYRLKDDCKNCTEESLPGNKSAPSPPENGAF